MTEPPNAARIRDGYAAFAKGDMFGRLMEITEGTFHLDIRAVFADDEHGRIATAPPSTDRFSPLPVSRNPICQRMSLAAG